MNDDHLRPYMPTHGRLLLLLRAALPYTEDGGPFLVIRQSGPVYRHDVQVQRPETTLAQHLVLTGDDALAYAHTKGWQSILRPRPEELGDLARHAVTLYSVPEWASDFLGYQDYMTYGSGATRAGLIQKGNGIVAARARREFVR